MNFDTYPFDNHICPFELGSDNYGVEDILLQGYVYFDKEKQRPLQYSVTDFSITSLPQLYLKLFYRLISNPFLQMVTTGHILIMDIIL